MAASPASGARHGGARQGDDALCPYFKAAMAVLGRRWNGLIIAVLGEGGSLRFSALRERLPAVGDRMLAARLRELEAHGLVVRSVSAGPPVRVAYGLTPAGKAFGAVSRAISRWGQRFTTPANRRPAKAPAPSRAAGR
jgi:DNA-binding HxlR family transcriptional regulator